MKKTTTCANRIKEALSIRNMTQAELCEKTGIKKSAMSQYCKGSFAPRQDKTFLIAKALDVSEIWLMGFDVPMDKKKPDAKSTELDENKQFLLDVIPQLSDEDVLLLRSIVDRVRSERE